MSIIFFLIGASTIVAVIFLAAFVWAMRNGQYDDEHSPAVRILGDGPKPVQAASKAPNTKP